MGSCAKVRRDIHSLGFGGYRVLKFTTSIQSICMSRHIGMSRISTSMMYSVKSQLTNTRIKKLAHGVRERQHSTCTSMIGTSQCNQNAAQNESFRSSIIQGWS